MLTTGRGNDVVTNGRSTSLSDFLWKKN